MLTPNQVNRSHHLHPHHLGHVNPQSANCNPRLHPNDMLNPKQSTKNLTCTLNDMFTPKQSTATLTCTRNDMLTPKQSTGTLTRSDLGVRITGAVDTSLGEGDGRC